MRRLFFMPKNSSKEKKFMFWTKKMAVFDSQISIAFV